MVPLSYHQKIKEKIKMYLRKVYLSTVSPPPLDLWLPIHWNASRLTLRSHGIVFFHKGRISIHGGYLCRFTWVGFYSQHFHCCRRFKCTQTLGLCDRVNSGIKCYMRSSYKEKWEGLKRSVWGKGCCCLWIRRVIVPTTIFLSENILRWILQLQTVCV